MPGKGVIYRMPVRALRHGVKRDSSPPSSKMGRPRECHSPATGAALHLLSISINTQLFYDKFNCFRGREGGLKYAQQSGSKSMSLRKVSQIEQRLEHGSTR